MSQEAIDLDQFQSRFAAEKDCIGHLLSQRWPDGFVCPRCGHRRFSFHRARRLHQCSSCKYQVSVTAGTVFHKTRTPLRKWFWMIFLMTRQKSGASMMSLQRMLGIKSYKTVWTMGHKIRKAMADRESNSALGGIIEPGGDALEKTSPFANDQEPQMSREFEVAQQSGHKITRNPDISDELQVYDQHESREAKLDEWQVYGELGNGQFEPNQVKVRVGKEALRNVRWIQALLSNLKGNIKGVHHGVSAKHLNRYFSEYVYRFNRRRRESHLFAKTVRACAHTSTITFAELTK